MLVTRRPRSSYWDDSLYDMVHTPDSLTVIEEDRGEWTGILDQDGDELWRIRDSVPMGFHVRGKRSVGSDAGP